MKRSSSESDFSSSDEENKPQRRRGRKPLTLDTRLDDTVSEPPRSPLSPANRSRSFGRSNTEERSSSSNLFAAPRLIPSRSPEIPSLLPLTPGAVASLPEQSPTSSQEGPLILSELSRLALGSSHSPFVPIALDQHGSGLDDSFDSDSVDDASPVKRKSSDVFKQHKEHEPKRRRLTPVLDQGRSRSPVTQRRLVRRSGASTSLRRLAIKARQRQALQQRVARHDSNESKASVKPRLVPPLLPITVIDRHLDTTSASRLFSRIAEFRNVLLDDDMFEQLGQSQLAERFSSHVYYKSSLNLLDAVSSLARLVEHEFSLDLDLNHSAQHFLCSFLFHQNVLTAFKQYGADEIKLEAEVRSQSGQLVYAFKSLAAYARHAAMACLRNGVNKVVVVRYLDLFCHELKQMSTLLMKVASLQHDQVCQALQQDISRLYEVRRTLENNPARLIRERYDALTQLYQLQWQAYQEHASETDCQTLKKQIKEWDITWKIDGMKRSVLEDSHEAALNPRALLDCFGSSDHTVLKLHIAAGLSGKILSPFDNDRLFLLSRPDSEKGKPVSVIALIEKIKKLHARLESVPSSELQGDPLDRLQSEFLGLKTQWLCAVTRTKAGQLTVREKDVPVQEVYHIGIVLNQIAVKCLMPPRDCSALVIFFNEMSRVVSRLVKDKATVSTAKSILAEKVLASHLYAPDTDMKAYLFGLFQFVISALQQLLSASRQAEFNPMLASLKAMADSTDNVGLLCARSAEVALDMINAVQYDRVLQILSHDAEGLRQKELASESDKVKALFDRYEVNLDHVDSVFRRLFPTVSLAKTYSSQVTHFMVRELFLELMTRDTVRREDFPHTLILDYRRLLNYKRYYNNAALRYVMMSTLIFYCNQKGVVHSHLDYAQVAGFAGEMMLQLMPFEHVVNAFVKQLVNKVDPTVSLDLSVTQQADLTQLILKNCDTRSECYRVTDQRLRKVVDDIFQFSTVDYSKHKIAWVLPVIKLLHAALRDLPLLYQNHLILYKGQYESMMKEYQIYHLVKLMLAPMPPKREELGHLLQVQYDQLKQAYDTFNSSVVLATALSVTQSFSQDLNHNSVPQEGSDLGQSDVDQFVEAHPGVARVFRYRQYNLEQKIQFIRDYHQLPLVNRPFVNLLQLEGFLDEQSFFEKFKQPGLTPSTVVALLIVLIPRFLHQQGFVIDQDVMRQYADMLKLIVNSHDHGGRRLYQRNMARLIHRFIKTSADAIKIYRSRDAASFTVRESLQSTALSLRGIFNELRRQADEVQPSSQNQVPVLLRSGVRR